MTRARLSDLIPDLIAGDDRAGRLLVDAAFNRLFGLAVRNGASREDAEEVALDVIWAVLSKVSGIAQKLDAGVEDPLYSYMAKAVVRGVYERYRRRQTELGALGKVVTVGGAHRIGNTGGAPNQVALWSSQGLEPAGYSAELEQVQRFVRSLSDDERLLVERRAYTTFTWEDIAGELGIAAPTLRKRWQRLLDRFAHSFFEAAR